MSREFGVDPENDPSENVSYDRKTQTENGRMMVSFQAMVSHSSATNDALLTDPLVFETEAEPEETLAGA